MFIGHFAVAFAAKKAAPKTSLATLFAASQFLDLLWPVCILLGLEHVKIEVGNTVVTPMNFYDYPLTHSLLGASLWAVLFGTCYYLIRKLPKESLIVAGVVFSHWLLDFFTHRPDLPLAGNDSLKVGLGLWNSLAGTLCVEFGLFFAGAYLYSTATKAKNKTGTYAFLGLLLFLTVMHLGNIFGPPPPSVEMIAIAGNALWLLVLWAWWIDKNRAATVLQ